MSYNYATQKPAIFTESGQVMFLAIRDNAQKLLKLAGAVRLQELIRESSGDTWDMLACVDRLVELGELCEVTKPDAVAGQYRVFTAPHRV